MVKTDLKTLAYNTVKQKTVACEYAPGIFLNEEILIDELEISRTPIRDALSRLEQEGLIEMRPKKGITVTALFARDMNMIFEMRKLYEPCALENCDSLLDKDKLNESYHVSSHKDASSECFQNNNCFYDLDSSFHQMIMGACFNVHLRQNYVLIQTQNERFRFMTGNISNNRPEDALRKHIDITIPCLQRDWDTAVERLSYHLGESKRSTSKLVSDSINNSSVRF